MRGASIVAVLVVVDRVAAMSGTPIVRPAVIAILTLHTAALLRATSVRSVDDVAAIILALLTGAVVAGVGASALMPLPPPASPDLVRECMSAFALMVVIAAAGRSARVPTAFVAMAILGSAQTFAHPLLLVGFVASTSLAGARNVPVGSCLLAQLLGVLLALGFTVVVRHQFGRRP
jgi:hypothetical protein